MSSYASLALDLSAVVVRGVPKSDSGEATFASASDGRYLQTMDVSTSEAPVNVKAIDLSGEWLGFYTGHFDEVVRITQRGDWIEAIKITGDDFVPAEEITFRANVTTGRGEGQIAEREFRNARFVPGTLKIVNEDKIVFRWEQCGEVEFRRDE
jgi:hypothetical protein